ncbi:MAG: HyaD/HybD family hydrogenase maturation endopeptidase [Chloroflexi bacterium]|nr:HyaD/HybD family hydrogenase maturation endopeptidase [Chloroflexota bacterium]
MTKRKIILGIGNTLNTDEGLGVHALDELRARLDKQDQLEILDGGTLGLNLLSIVEEASHLVVLDAVNTGKTPGTVVELKKEDIPLFRGIKMSDHQITFQEVLGLAKIRDKFPQNLHLIGAQPADLSIGVGLSPTIEAVMPEIIERTISILKTWRIIPVES